MATLHDVDVEAREDDGTGLLVTDGADPGFIVQRLLYADPTQSHETAMAPTMQPDFNNEERAETVSFEGLQDNGDTILSKEQGSGATSGWSVGTTHRTTTPLHSQQILSASFSLNQRVSHGPCACSQLTKLPSYMAAPHLFGLRFMSSLAVKLAEQGAIRAPPIPLHIAQDRKEECACSFVGQDVVNYVRQLFPGIQERRASEFDQSNAMNVIVEQIVGARTNILRAAETQKRLLSGRSHIQNGYAPHYADRRTTGLRRVLRRQPEPSSEDGHAPKDYWNNQVTQAQADAVKALYAQDMI